MTLLLLPLTWDMLPCLHWEDLLVSHQDKERQGGGKKIKDFERHLVSLLLLITRYSPTVRLVTEMSGYR